MIFKNICKLGKIINNSSFDYPMIVFNTVNFDIQEFDYNKGAFESLRVIDEFNIKDKIPSYFRSKVISNEKIIIVGGVNQQTMKSSNRIFQIDNGKLIQLNAYLKIAREYHDIWFDKQGSSLYIIGGYNDTLGVLSSWEKLWLKTNEITQIDSMIIERLSWTSTIINSSFIYVFNGIGNKCILNTIEKYNIKLGYWEMLENN